MVLENIVCWFKGHNWKEVALCKECTRCGKEEHISRVKRKFKREVFGRGYGNVFYKFRDEAKRHKIHYRSPVQRHFALKWFIIENDDDAYQADDGGVDFMIDDIEARARKFKKYYDVVEDIFGKYQAGTFIEVMNGNEDKMNKRCNKGDE